MSEKLWTEPWRQVYLDHPDHSKLTEICVCCEKSKPNHKDGCYLAKLEAESKAGARLGIAVRRSNAYNIVNLFYKTAVDEGDATFHKDLKLLEPEVKKDGAILVEDELAALETDECAHPNAVSAKNEVVESGMYCPDCQTIFAELETDNATG